MSLHQDSEYQKISTQLAKLTTDNVQIEVTGKSMLVNNDTGCKVFVTVVLHKTGWFGSEQTILKDVVGTQKTLEFESEIKEYSVRLDSDTSFLKMRLAEIERLYQFSEKWNGNRQFKLTSTINGEYVSFVTDESQIAFQLNHIRPLSEDNIDRIDGYLQLDTDSFVLKFGNEWKVVFTRQF